MNTSITKLIYSDNRSSIQDILNGIKNTEASIQAQDLTISDSTKNSDNEIWSPQLKSYKAWLNHHDKIQTLGFEKANREIERIDQPYDLLTSGNLAFGSAEPVREQIIQEAKRKKEKSCSQVTPFVQKPEALTSTLKCRPNQTGYCLTEINLHKIAQAIGSTENLVIILPSFIDSKPLTEIAANVVIKRTSQGVSVKLFVIPDTVTSIGSDALSSMKIGHIHIGKQLKEFKSQNFSAENILMHKQTITFSVDADNPNFTKVDGCLLTHDGRELLFKEAPYEASLTLPDTIEHIHAKSFISEIDMPELVHCPSSLKQLETKELDNAIWVCKPTDEMYDSLYKRNIRIAHSEPVYADECWYDLTEKDAYLLLGPKEPLSPSKRFALIAAAKAQGKDSSTVAIQGQEELLKLPAIIEGKSLARINKRALVTAPKTLIIPDTVVSIEDGNTCKGTQEIILSQNLKTIGKHCFNSRSINKVIIIPKSVHSIGEGSFEYAKLYFEAVNTIVHIPADQMKQCFIQSSNPQALPFDFNRYDEILISKTNIPDRLEAILNRLNSTVVIDEDCKKLFIAYLLQNKEVVFQKVAQSAQRSLINALISGGFITDETFDDQIELLRLNNKKEAIIQLMNWKHNTLQADRPSIKNKFSL